MNTPLLSVCLITYNHALYLRQAIESIMMQQVNCMFEIIIADDFSTDGTRDIIAEYHRRYPDIIKPLLQQSNVGPGRNFVDLLSSINASSRYVAYLEGDDYWTDPLKLQRQLDFLEVNPTMYACFHDVNVVDENGRVLNDHYYSPPKEILSQQDCLVYGGAYCTGSLMLRGIVLKDLPEWFIKSPTDYAVDLLITEFGDIAHINENMGAYRIHQGGTWQGNATHKNWEKVIVRYKVCLSNPTFKKKYGAFFYQRIADHASRLALYYQKEKHQVKRFKYVWYYIFYSRPKSKAVVNYLVGTLLFPTALNKIKLFFSKPAKNDKG